MKISVWVFGRYKDIAAIDHIIFDMKEGCTIRDIIDTFVKHYPSTEIDKNRMMVLKNKIYVSHDTRLIEGDEITICPPVVSGG
jgi:molybdopterin converting factor small subunit